VKPFGFQSFVQAVHWILSRCPAFGSQSDLMLASPTS